MHEIIWINVKISKIKNVSVQMPVLMHPVTPSGAFLEEMGVFSLPPESCVWMPMAGGMTMPQQSSGTQTSDPSQLACLPSNLPVTPASEETRRNGYPNSAAYWQWRLQFTGERPAYLQRAASISFLREGRRDSPRRMPETRFRQKSIFCPHLLAPCSARV